jgi:hypothetical protein
MVDTFASCGATSFVVTKTELEWPDHKKAKWGKDYSLESLREKLPAIVRTAAIRHPVRLPDGQEVMAGENVIIRPTGPDVAFVQLDDLNTTEQLESRPPRGVHHSRDQPRQLPGMGSGFRRAGREGSVQDVDATRAQGRWRQRQIRLACNSTRRH